MTKKPRDKLARLLNSALSADVMMDHAFRPEADLTPEERAISEALRRWAR